MKAVERAKLVRSLRQESRRLRLLVLVIGFFLVTLTAGAAEASAARGPPGEGRRPRGGRHHRGLAALAEPANALSLPTWPVQVSGVAEWVTAMALVWDYGECTGLKGWKGLFWGMVPLLGGAMCACTWHFFYNSESLEDSTVPYAGRRRATNLRVHPT